MQEYEAIFGNTHTHTKAMAKLAAEARAAMSAAQSV
jgi:hypothetical protein